jgi:hypothetical protein
MQTQVGLPWPKPGLRHPWRAVWRWSARVVRGGPDRSAFGRFLVASAIAPLTVVALIALIPFHVLYTVSRLILRGLDREDETEMRLARDLNSGAVPSPRGQITYRKGPGSTGPRGYTGD